MDGLAEGSGDRDQLFRRAGEVAQCHEGHRAYPIDPDTGARREKPLLAFACTNSGRGRSGVVVNGLRGWLVECYPLKVVDVETGYRAALLANRLRPLRGRFITEKRRPPAPAPETDYAALAESGCASSRRSGRPGCSAPATPSGADATGWLARGTWKVSTPGDHSLRSAA